MSANPVAVAEINNMTYAAVVQPIIPEMSNDWTPMGSFGGEVCFASASWANLTSHLPEKANTSL